MRGTIPPPHFLGSKKRQHFLFSVQSQRAQCVCQVGTFQDGEYPHGEEPDSAGGGDWMCTTDLKDTYFSLHISLCDPKYLQVSVAESIEQIPGFPIQVVGSSQGLHKAVAPSDRPSEEAGVQADDLSGRYYHAEPTEGPTRTGAGFDCVVAATVGLHNQLEQVKSVTDSTGSLSGVSDRLD